MMQIQMLRDDTLTIESLDGNKLYLDSTTQFRMYTMIGNDRVKLDRSLKMI